MNREDKSFAQNSKQFIMLSLKWEIITPYLCMGACIVISDFLVRSTEKKKGGGFSLYWRNPTNSTSATWSSANIGTIKLYE